MQQTVLIVIFDTNAFKDDSYDKILTMMVQSNDNYHYHVNKSAKSYYYAEKFIVMLCTKCLSAITYRGSLIAIALPVINFQTRNRSRYYEHLKRSKAIHRTETKYIFYTILCTSVTIILLYFIL